MTVRVEKSKLLDEWTTASAAGLPSGSRTAAFKVSCADGRADASAFWVGTSAARQSCVNAKTTVSNAQDTDLALQDIISTSL
ncbi:MAG: hypothetical protein ACREJB_17480 [Planctomycetaceae bacterium]